MNSLFLVFLSFLLMTLSVEAKDSFDKFTINGTMGYFLPKIHSEVDKLYGSGRVFSLGGEYDLSSVVSLRLCLDYKKLDYNEKEKGWEMAKVEEDCLEIMPLTFSIIYKMPVDSRKDFLPYIGGGIGIYLAKLRFEVSEIQNPYETWNITLIRDKFRKIQVSNSNLTDNKSAKTTGFQLLAGFRYRLFSQIFLNGELKYAYALIPEWDDIDVGGITIVSGINYSF